MKKILLITIVCLSFETSIIAQQNYAVLGDEALNNGFYQKAIEYYTKAFEQIPTDELNNKIKFAKTLKYEFDEIDKAIIMNNFQLAEVHIDNVLKINPTNKFVQNKRDLIQQKQENNRKLNYQKNWAKFSAPFKGNDDYHELFGGFHLRTGYTFISENFYFPFVNTDTLMPVNKDYNGYNVDLYYNISKKIPLTIDIGMTMNKNFIEGESSKVSFHKFHFGLSYAIRPFKKLNIDLGGGYNFGAFSCYSYSKNTTVGWSEKVYDTYKFSDMYYKLGFTLILDNRNGGGFSYHYISDLNSKNRLSYHSISYVFGTKPTQYITSFAFIIGLLSLASAVQ
jgi:tetratricopeptide (TPR) repeat protein